MTKIYKLLLILFQTIVIFITVGAFTTAITKNIYSRILIEEFKSKAKYNSSKSSNFTKIYEILSLETKEPYQQNFNNYYPGGSSDILISLKSEIKTPFIGDFISFFAGGHAALVLDSYGDVDKEFDETRTLESTGLVEGIEFATDFAKDYWIAEAPYNEVIVLRVKLTENEQRIIQSNAMAMIGDPYNYSFVLGTKNKSYCTDIISKIYGKIGKNLNKDGFTTSVYDLLVSNETYIAYYHYYDYDGVKHIYYLA